MPTPCTVCGDPRRAEIDVAIHAKTSFRSVGRTFSIPKDTIARHARAHCGVGVPAKRAVTNARRRANRATHAQVMSVKPIESAEDVVEDMQRLRAEAFALFDAAKARSDWKQAQLLFNQLVALVDRFGEMHRVLGSKGVNVTIDRSTRVLNVLGQMDEGDLRALLARADAGGPIALPEVPDAG